MRVYKMQLSGLTAQFNVALKLANEPVVSSHSALPALSVIER